MVVMVVVRGCGAVLARVGVARRFSGIRAGVGPVRYNPQEPEGAKPAKREEGRVAHSRPVQLWKRAPKEWSLRDVQEEVGKGGGEDEDESFAEAEMRRLRAEMKLRGSSSSAVSRRNAEEKHELQSLRARESEGLDAALATKNRSRGEELLCGDLESSILNREVQTMEKKKKKRNALPGSGLVYGDGRKFEGVIPNATDLFDDPFIASEGELFKIAETEEDKTIAQEKQAAKDYALRLLAMAPQPERKLRQKLISRNVSESVIDSTIADLQRCGLQSDLEFAEAFARSRWRSSLWGPQRLKQELRQRGVCGEHIDVALEKVFSSSTEDALVDEGDLEGRWGMTREASEHLWGKVKLQWRRGGSTVSEETRKRRMVGWLQRRGFNWSITSEILKSLESQD